MNKNVFVVVVLGAALVTGCGSDGTGLSRTQVEDRVAAEVSNNEGHRADAHCVEVSEDRAFRCDVTFNSATSRYEARVSKDGKRVVVSEPTTQAPSAAAEQPDVTRGVEPGEVGVVVTEDSLRLTTRTGARRNGFLVLAIDNRAERRLEVVLARATRPPRLWAASGLPALSSTRNELQVPAGRYVIVAREPIEGHEGPSAAVSGFAQAALRVR